MKAIDVALKIYRRPSLVRAERHKPLPEDVLPVIRLAGGGDVTPEFLTTERAKSETEAREASIFYLQQVLLSPKSNEFKQLGLPDNATLQQISEHKRHMLKWLHPDRNPNKWESALFQRVALAAEKLERKHGLEVKVTEPLRLMPERRKKQRKLARYPVQPSLKKQSWYKRNKKLVLRTSVSVFVFVFILVWRFYSARWLEWYETQVIGLVQPILVAMNPSHAAN